MTTTVILNRRALSDILRGKQGNLTADLEARGRRVTRAAGPRFEQETWVGRNRVRVSVRSTRPSATNERTLMGALSAGRG